VKILIAATAESCSGREEVLLASALTDVLSTKYRVDSFILPYEPDILATPEQITATQLLTLEDTDMLITIGYPAMFLNHPNKRICLADIAPTFHEYWNTHMGVLDVPATHRARVAMIQAETVCLRSAHAIVCGSRLLQNDLQSRYKVRVTMHHFSYPLPSEENIAETFSPYFVAIGSLSPSFRMHLLVDSIAESHGAWTLQWFIPHGHSMYTHALAEYIRTKGLEHRILLHYRSCPPAVLRNSHGYICLAHKPRRIPAPLIYAVQLGISIAIPRDGGAMTELTKPSFAPIKTDISSYLDNLAIQPVATHVTHDALPTEISTLAERLVS